MQKETEVIFDEYGFYRFAMVRKNAKVPEGKIVDSFNVESHSKLFANTV